MAKVIELTAKDVRWPFEADPYVMIGGGRYPRRTNVDPFPCYPHDAGLVKELADEVMACWPLPFEVTFYVVHFETSTRTQALAQIDALDYDDKGKAKQWVESIAFWGKRIPIHPATTKYLVAHEYGHAVEDAIVLQRGEQPGGDTFLAEYRKLRGLESLSSYGGATWHLDAGEIFANDFRILVTGVEPDFWPHPGIPRPEDISAVRDWWEARKAELR